MQYLDTRNGRDRYQDIEKDLNICGLNADDAVILTPSEYTEILGADTDLEQLFELYFAFDATAFAQLQGWFLLTFVSAYAVGKTINILGLSNKTND